MAVVVLTSATVQLGTAWTGTAPGTPGTQTVSGTISSASDVTTYTRQVEFPLSAATQDATNFGSGGYTLNVVGLRSSAVSLTFNQDFAGSALDQIIMTTLGFGSTIYVDVRPTSAARGATNPSYVFACLLTEWTPVAGSVGDLVMPSVTWPVTGAWARLTS